MLLFSDIHRIDPVSFQCFQTPTEGSFGKHNVQMGLPEGHSVLLHFSQNGMPYQAVLVSMNMLCGSMSCQCQPISLGCRKTLQRLSVP